MSTPAPVKEGWLRHPAWLRPGLLERGVEICVVLAWFTELVRVTVHGHPLGGYAAVAVSVVGMALTRRAPKPGLVVIGSAPLIAAALGWDPIVTWTVAVFAVFLHALGGASAAISGVLLGVGNYCAVAIFDAGGFLGANALIAATSTVAGAALGSAVCSQRRYWSELEQRTADALATRESEANRRVAEERLRIARDLHDVVGHEIAVISMHLGVAETSLPPTAEAAHSALTAAHLGVQSVLRETQQILKVLRLDEERQVDPPPDFLRIPALVDSYRSLGLRIEADLHEDAAVLDPAVSTAAYRITQEMLTNAHRHSKGSVTLRVELEGQRLTIEATNPRPFATSARRLSGQGYGLVGMRERAESAGGHLTVDESNDVFRVIAIFRVQP